MIPAFDLTMDSQGRLVISAEVDGSTWTATFPALRSATVEKHVHTQRPEPEAVAS